MRKPWSLVDAGSDIEEEIQHIPVLDHVFLAFGPHLASVLGGLLTLEVDEVLEGDGLGANETTLEVGVDDARGLRCGVADVDGQARTSFTPAVK